MNVLYVTQHFSFTPTHAAAVTTYEIVKALAKRGHKVTVLVPSPDLNNPTNPVTTKPEAFSNIDVISFTSTLSNLMQENLALYGLMCTFWYAPLIGKALKKANYDLIISMYHPSHLATFSAYLLSRSLKLPLVVKVHDLLPDVTDPNFVARAYKKVLFKLNSAVLKRGSLILVPSVEWVDLAVKVYGADKTRLILFPNGVDVQKFHPLINGSKLREKFGLEGQKILLFVGKISRDRGLDCLIKALPSILREEPDVRLLLIGEGPEKSRLIDLSRQLGVIESVRFLGWVDHNSIPKYISLADIAIGPLARLDVTLGTIPTKVLEYMACGKSVVACYGGVSKGLIIDGQSGMLVESGNVKQLQSAIIGLLLDNKLALKIGENARRIVEMFYNWEFHAEKLEGILGSITKDKCYGELHGSADC